MIILGQAPDGLNKRAEPLRRRIELLRITARFLGVDHYTIFVGFRTLPEGTAIVCEDPSDFDVPDAWALLQLDGEVTPDSSARMIKTAVDAGVAK